MYIFNTHRQTLGRAIKEGQCPYQSDFCLSKFQLTLLVFGKLLMKFLNAFKVKFMCKFYVLHFIPPINIPYKACPQKYFLDPPLQTLTKFSLQQV